jgi:hypothetical protein
MKPRWKCMPILLAMVVFLNQLVYPKLVPPAGSNGFEWVTKLEMLQQESRPEKQLLPASRRVLKTASETVSRMIKKRLFACVELGINEDSITALPQIPKTASKAVSPMIRRGLFACCCRAWYRQRLYLGIHESSKEGIKGSITNDSKRAPYLL